MTPNPILKVLFTFKKHRVKALLIGGQACIVYGAAEFSRDTDFVILAQQINLDNLKAALKELKALPVFFPELKIDYLLQGHACHFRCHAPQVSDLRVDVMSRLRGCDEFNLLWKRRQQVRVSDIGLIDVISLQDLVRCKKTQRDKDWLMLGRLVENDIQAFNFAGSVKKVSWWFLESRNPATLEILAAKYPILAKKMTKQRNILIHILKHDIDAAAAALRVEEQIERAADKLYWEPLKKVLETMRLNR